MVSSLCPGCDLDARRQRVAQRMATRSIVSNIARLWHAGLYSIGAGLAATWIALALAYSGMRLKDIPRLLWVGFVAGWSLAAPLLWSVLPTPNYLQDRLGDYFFVRSLFGLGPLIYSAFILLWLYWNGKQKTLRNPVAWTDIWQLRAGSGLLVN
ncbi:hypothetical protein LZ012_14435 [Dechloromonas sp. XY25]|uniref:Uncharacterized protein n=1 Tax=Dechloromonas hankyongensis TaxID=2908002 RepID=A0ABS9K4W5_9RHOO|nr:hypothetical protein [Dechloromonas hankyongensis]MCG2578190.1 hypothetical protein [Dechloromonas hankyongensis]